MGDNVSDRNRVNGKYNRTYFSSPVRPDDDELSSVSSSRYLAPTNFNPPIRRNSKSSSVNSSQSPNRNKDIHAADWDSSVNSLAESNAQRPPALRQYFSSQFSPQAQQGAKAKRGSLLNSVPHRVRYQRSRLKSQVQVRNTNCSECFAYRWDGCVRCDICDVIICEYCRRHHVCSIQLRKPLPDDTIREGVLQSSCTAIC